MESCIKCSIKSIEMNKFDHEEECLQYLIDHNLIIERKCDSCQDLAITVKRNICVSFLCN